MTSNAPWTATRPSTTPTSPRPAANATSASRRPINKSVHGQLLAKGDQRGPVCTDCHTAHEIENPEDNNFKAISDARCGKCHADRLEHYRDTYHGKAMALGKPNVALRPWPPATTATAITTCCRPPIRRRIFRKPTSSPPARNVIPGATIGFTEYKPHANPMDAKHYPLLHAVFLGMTGLLIGTFAFFGLHTLVWLVRAIYLYLHDSKKFREAKIKTQVDDEWFTRFVPFERFLHFLVVTSFLLLVITGMPLKFYYTELGQGDLCHSRRAGHGAHAAPVRRAWSPSFTSACMLHRSSARHGRAGEPCAIRQTANSISSGCGTCCSGRTR